MDIGVHFRKFTRRTLLIGSQIDSPSFDAKAYYDQLITTSSLPNLLKRENDLVSGEYIAGRPKCTYIGLKVDA